MGENGKRISTLLSVLTNRNIICTRSYAMKLKGLATGERGDSLIQGICRCVRRKWFWSVSPRVLKFGMDFSHCGLKWGTVGSRYGFKKRNFSFVTHV